MKPKIGIITHYSKFQEQFAHLANKLDCELIFNFGLMEYAIAVAQQMEEENQVDAIISQEKTHQAIERYVNVPVVPIYIKDANLFNAFYRCAEIGDKIAFVDMIRGEPHYNFEHVRKATGYDIIHYQFEELDQLQSVLDNVLKDGRNVVATTASCMYRFAKKQGLNVVLIEHCEEDLISVIQHAKDILRIKHVEESKIRWLKAIMDNTDGGFITIDQNHIITSVNVAAQQALHYPEGELVGKPIHSLSSINSGFKRIIAEQEEIEIIPSGGQELVATKRDIFSDKTYLGSIIKIDVLKNIQKLEMQARKKLNASGFVAKHTFDDIIGESEVIANTKEAAKKFALTNSHILITGDSGSGKEMFAQSIHNYSNWRDGPFIALNCATLPENLLDSELFGYEDGAFTGAKKGGKPGLFELAHNGTLFLDELGEMPLVLQSKLLRVLQDKVVRRIGGSKNNPVNVRIIFATNRDLYQEVQKNNFRKDLFYRVNVLNLTIPPLSHRLSDVALIAMALAENINCNEHKKFCFTPAQLYKLQSYHWPGNVRELQNFVERIVALTVENTPSDELVQQSLSEMAASTEPQTQAVSELDSAVYMDKLSVPVGSLRDMESYIIQSLYRKYGGDKKRLCYILEMSSTTLWRRLKESLEDDKLKQSV